MISHLGGYGASGLQVGLDILDKPGRAVRGALAGKFRELGNLVPFSDSIGLTDGRDKTSGRDLTDAIGLTDRRSKGWGAWGAGLAAEMLTDPLTYITGGVKNALTPAGQVASKAGALKGWSRADILRGFDATESALGHATGWSKSAMEHAANQGQRVASSAVERAAAKAGTAIVPGQALGGLVGVGLPWGPPKLIFGTGKTALGIGSNLDLIGDKLKYGTTAGRWANSLFDPNVREAVGGATQQAMARYGTPAVEAARILGRDATHQVMSAIDDGIKIGIREDELLRAARQHAEGVNFRGVGPGAQAAAPGVGDVVSRMASDQLDAAQRIGLPLSDVADDYVRYAPRQGIDLDAIQRSAAGQPVRIGIPPAQASTIFPVSSAANLGRDELWRNIPGGTEMVNDWARQFAGDPGGMGVAGMRRQMIRDMVGEVRASGAAVNRQTVKALGDKADAVAERLAAMSPGYSTHQVGIFSPHVAADVARSAEQHARTMGTANAVMGFIGDNARATGSLPADAVPVSKLLGDLGFVTHDGKGVGHYGGMVEAYKRLAKQGAGRVDPLLTGTMADLRTAVDGFAVSRAHYDELMKSHARWSTPEVLGGPGGLLGNLTRTFKSLVYPIWPASHARNAFSAGLNNLLSGTGLGDHAAQFAIMRGTATADQLKRLVPDLPMSRQAYDQASGTWRSVPTTDAEAIDWVRRQQFATGKVYDGHVGQSDLDNALAAKMQAQVPGRVTPVPFGSDRTGGGNFARDASALIGGGVRDQLFDVLRWARHPRSAPSPLRMDGTWGGTSDFPLLATGRSVGSNIEDFFRGANWLGNRRAGMAASEAGQATRNLHFDYDQLTAFEKKVMRNVVPFYTFSRKNLPAQVDNLIRSPGSTTAQLRVFNSGQGDGGFVPGHLRSAGAIPVGPEEGGRRTFLSSFGTPLEEALGRFRFAGSLPDWRGTASQFAGMLNPLLKALIEQVTDTQLHTGRQLSAIQPGPTMSALGRILGDDATNVLSQAVSNTPATRFLSTVDRLFDDRKSLGVKALGLATGMGLTDIDVAKARQMEAAQARDKLLSTMPHVKSRMSYYVKPGDASALRPDEVEMLRLVATMQAQAREAAKLSQFRIGIRQN